MKKYTYILFAVIFAGFLLSSCDDYLDIKPKDRVIPEDIEDYRGLMTSAYNLFPATKARASVRSDEMTIKVDDYTSPYYRDIYLWRDANYDENTTEFEYGGLYRIIFYANEIINSGSEDMTNSDEKNQLLGEAYALRAYSYFELMNLFAKPYDSSIAETTNGVPLVLNIDLEAYEAPKTMAVIYAQIFLDISEAENLLTVDIQPSDVKYRFSKLSLQAFKTRVYLYQKEYEKALQEVNKLLAQNSELLDLNNNTENLLPNELSSPENIQGLDYAIDGNVNGMALVSDELLALYDTTNDMRFSLYYTFDGTNYKPVKGNAEKFKCSFRVGELLLVKAEALYKLGKESEAKTVLLTLAEKRYNSTGLANFETKLQGLSGENFFEELRNERFRETAFEGYRWFDLRRNDQKVITHKYSDAEATLQENDPRYTIEFPRSAKEENPNLE